MTSNGFNEGRGEVAGGGGGGWGCREETPLICRVVPLTVHVTSSQNHRRSLVCKSAQSDMGLSLECLLWTNWNNIFLQLVPDVRNFFQMFWPLFR